METIEVKARPRKLGRYHTVRRRGKKFNWFEPLRYTIEMLPMVHCHALDIEDILSLNITKEITNGR